MRQGGNSQTGLISFACLERVHRPTNPAPCLLASSHSLKYSSHTIAHLFPETTLPVGASCRPLTKAWYLVPGRSIRVIAQGLTLNPKTKHHRNLAIFTSACRYDRLCACHPHCIAHSMKSMGKALRPSMHHCSQVPNLCLLLLYLFSALALTGPTNESARSTQRPYRTECRQRAPRQPRNLSSSIQASALENEALLPSCRIRQHAALR